jgi:hypothetical protein
MLDRDGERKKRIGTAYHEAGHAVVGAHLGLHITQIDPVPMGAESEAQRPWDGICHFAELPDAMSDEDFLTVARAGFVAEKQLCDLNGWSSVQAHVGALNDSRSVHDRLQGWNGGTTELYIAMHERAEAILRSRWSAIEALAQVLLEGVTLEGPRAHEIISRALEAK